MDHNTYIGCTAIRLDVVGSEFKMDEIKSQVWMMSGFNANGSRLSG